MTDTSQNRPGWLERFRARLPHREPVGMRYALRILVGTLAAWKLFNLFGDRYPIWATISVVMVSEIELKATLDATKSRVAHTATGCAIGLIFLAAFGTGLWQLSVAAAAASLVSFYLVHAGGNWRAAPAASVIAMATGVEHFSKLAGMDAALQRTAEVLFGSLVALAVSWAAAKMWKLSIDATEHL